MSPREWSQWAWLAIGVLGCLVIGCVGGIALIENKPLIFKGAVGAGGVMIFYCIFMVIFYRKKP